MGWFSKSSDTEKMSALKNVVAMMMADGKIDESEKALLAGICARLGATADDVETILRDPTKVNFVVPSSDKEKVLQLIDSVFMMIVDGNIDPNEMELCLRLAQVLGFDPAIVPKVVETIVQAVKQGHDRNQAADLASSLIGN